MILICSVNYSCGQIHFGCGGHLQMSPQIPFQIPFQKSLSLPLKKWSDKIPPITSLPINLFRRLREGNKDPWSTAISCDLYIRWCTIYHLHLQIILHWSPFFPHQSIMTVKWATDNSLPTEEIIQIMVRLLIWKEGITGRNSRTEPLNTRLVLVLQSHFKVEYYYKWEVLGYLHWILINLIFHSTLLLYCMHIVLFCLGNNLFFNMMIYLFFNMSPSPSLVALLYCLWRITCLPCCCVF